MAKTCPVCGLLSPPEALRCDCGWDFTDKLVEPSYVNPRDPTNVAELGMTLAQVGRRNITSGLGSLATGVLILVLAISMRDPNPTVDPGRSAPLLYGLWFSGAALVTGVGLVIRGWVQRRSKENRA